MDTKFLSKLKDDPAFAAKYRSLGNADAVIKQAQADGYDLTVTDLEKANSARVGELSENELAAVSGGKDTFYWLCPHCGDPYFAWVRDQDKCGYCGKAIWA